MLNPNLFNPLWHEKRRICSIQEFNVGEDENCRNHAGKRDIKSTYNDFRFILKLKVINLVKLQFSNFRLKKSQKH